MENGELLNLFFKKIIAAVNPPSPNQKTLTISLKDTPQMKEQENYTDNLKNGETFFKRTSH